MKYPQSVAMPRDVQDWLEGELEARGIDSAVYTRYILSLMLQDSLDFDLYNSNSDFQCYAKGVWSGKQLNGNCELWNQHDHKRLAVIRCLMSATGKNCEMESLVDQLFLKLKAIQGSDAMDNTAIQPSQFFTYSDYNNAFPPLQKSIEEFVFQSTIQPPSAWARGILRASLKEIDTAASYDDIKPTNDFPLTYCGSKTMYGNALDIYGPRLYERSANRSLERVMAGLDATFHQFWNPKDVSSPQTSLPNQNHTFFQYDSKPFSSECFLGSMFEKSDVPPIPWSLGESEKEEISEKQVEISAVVIEPPKENLLTSDRTHFRPIHSEFTSRHYEDGTTFALSNALQPLPFQRSESGTLFLDTGKYMEYKKNDEEWSGEDEFVPKFRVQQSNEKFCQTDDIELVSPTNNDTSSVGSRSPEIDTDEFYFPGDDDLVVDSSSEDQVDGGEVAGVVTGCLNVRWKEITESPSFEEAKWDTQDQAMVDELVDSPEWKLCSDTDDGMDDVDSADVSSSGFWPQWSDSIWNPKVATQACESCGGGPVPQSNEQTTNILGKEEWQELWKQPICKGCNEITHVENCDEAKTVAEDLVVDEDIWKWPKLGATLSAYLRQSRAQDVDLLHVWGPEFNSSLESINNDGLREIWTSENCNSSLDAWSPQLAQSTQVGKVSNRCTYNLMKDELCQDGNQLLSDLSGLQLCEIDAADADACDLLDEEQDTFPTDPPSPINDQLASFVSLWATWNIIAVGEDKNTFDERTYHHVQNERKRRHSSSQRMCEEHLQEECRRAHCRFRKYMSPRIHETKHQFRYGHDVNRAFTV